MKQRILPLILLFALVLAVKGQTPLRYKHDLLYSETTINNGKSSLPVAAIIDTGATFCVLDSAFAVDSCNVRLDEAKKIRLVSADEAHVGAWETALDSLSFCGNTYRHVACIVFNVAEKLQHYAPRFFIGGNVLKEKPLLFNLKDMVVSTYDVPEPIVSYTMKWKGGEHFSKVGHSLIVLKAKVNGKRGHFILDSGSRYNNLPRNIKLEATREVDIETATAAKKLAMERVKVVDHAAVELGNQHLTLSFRLTNRRLGALNFDLLKGRSFVLNYAERTLMVLP